MSKKILNIGYDASFAPSFRSGVSVYSHQLLRHLSKIDKYNKYTVFPFFYYHFLPEYKSYKPKLSSNFSLFLDFLPTSLVKVIWKNLIPKFDIFHSTTFTIPPKKIYKKLIVTIYDTTFYTHPQYHLKENIDQCLKNTKLAVKKADIIIAISNQTKKDLISYFDCPANKIRVTYLACDKRFFKKINKSDKQHTLDKFDIKKPFIFHLGSLEPRKNTLGLIKAFQLLPKKYINKYDLVVAGGKGWMNNSITDYLSRHPSGNIKLIGYIDNNDLINLYQSAKLFAYPSFYEGFGLPCLEAMASGCPILTSNVSSLPEVCQKAALYCDPKDIEDISKKLLKMLKIKNTDLIRQGTIQAKKFSWTKTARQTLDAYNLFS